MFDSGWGLSLIVFLPLLGAGVVMAIQAVEKAADDMRDGGLGELSVYHAIVHNDTVVDRLEVGHPAYDGPFVRMGLEG